MGIVFEQRGSFRVWMFHDGAETPRSAEGLSVQHDETCADDGRLGCICPAGSPWGSAEGVNRRDLGALSSFVLFYFLKK